MYYRELDIFAPAYSMVVQLLPKINRINRSYRFTIGDFIKESSLEMLSLINITNTSPTDKERLEHLREFMIQFENVNLGLRLCIDLHLLNHKTLSPILPLIKDVRNQHNRWKKYYERKLSTQS